MKHAVVPHPLDPRCKRAARIKVRLLHYADQPAALRFVRRALTLSHLCRCRRCRRHAQQVARREQ